MQFRTSCPRRKATAALYETSGDWLYDIRLAGKRETGGGFVTDLPGLGTFAPPLDAAGNSVNWPITPRLRAKRGINRKDQPA